MILELLTTRRFLPLFIAQFFGAFNDYVFKTMLAVMMAYGVWGIQGVSSSVLVALASALFIIPFVLFCPYAGNLNDHQDKAWLMRRIKLAEIGLSVLAVISLALGSLWLALAVLFGLGVQAAFFSPGKFSLLPQHLETKELLAANGLIATGTYLAILLGTIAGSLLALMNAGSMWASCLMLGSACAGYGAACFVPAAPSEKQAAAKDNFVIQSLRVFRFALTQKPIVLVSIVSTSWFYFYAATVHAQFPNFTRQSLQADNMVLTMFMVLFSLGISAGGLLNHFVLKGKNVSLCIGASCFFMGALGCDLYFVSSVFPAPPGQGLHTVSSFLTHREGLRLSLDMFLQAVAGGFFIVPLRAIVQEKTAQEVRSRVISASNLMDAIFMLASALLTAALFGVGMRVEEVYLLVSLLSMVVGAGLWKYFRTLKG